jgi:Tfp pilus assembly protein PilF
MNRHSKHIAASLQSVLVALCLSGCNPFVRRDSCITCNSAGPASSSNQTLPAAESARLCLATAETMEREEKYPEAIELYEKARQLDHQAGVKATRHLAFIHDRMGNFDRALEEYRRAMKDNPRDAALLNNLGYGYYNRGEWAAAEKQLRKAVDLEPKLASAWINLGMCLAVQGRYEEGLAAFEKAVTKAQAHCNLGYIQATQGKIAEARRNYELALRIEPGSQMAGAALQKLGQPRAQNAVQQAEARPDILHATPPSFPFEPVQQATKQ